MNFTIMNSLQDSLCQEDGTAMIAVYVDDCLLAAKTEEKLNCSVERLTQGFEIKSIVSITEFYKNGG